MCCVVCVCACMSAHMCALTVSDMIMHHVLIILLLTFIYSRTDLNHENDKCLIISETIPAVPTKFVVKIVLLKVYITIASPMSPTKGLDYHCQSNDLDLHSRSQMHQFFNLQYIGQYLSYYIQTWHGRRLMHDMYAQAHFDYLELDLDFENVCKACTSCFSLNCTIQPAMLDKHSFLPFFIFIFIFYNPWLTLT